MEIIPAIDLINKQCVRLTKGDFSKVSIYESDPVKMAVRFEKAGYKSLHLVDLDGAKYGASENISVLKSICEKTMLKIDFGGGISNEIILKEVFDLGTSKVSIGSLAVKNPTLLNNWIDKYGADKFIIAADVLQNKIVVNGWQQESDKDLIPFIHSFYKKGVRSFLCTDISRDGMLNGPSFDLYLDILNEFPDLNLIASGGVSSVDDLKMLESLKVPSAVIGKAFYEGLIPIDKMVELC